MNRPFLNSKKKYEIYIYREVITKNSNLTFDEWNFVEWIHYVFLLDVILVQELVE